MPLFEPLPYAPRRVSPKNYGGKGDGVVDDSAAVNRAIATGRGVDFSGGTWAVKDISVTASTTCPGFFSDGTGTITPASGSTSSTILFTITKDDFRVDGLFFNLPISTTSGAAPACDRALYFVNNSGASRHSVTNCRFVGGSYGPYFGGISNYVRCQNNLITSVWAAALSVEAPNNCIISGNEISDCGFDSVASGAIRLGTSGQLAVARNVAITGNTIVRCCESFNQEGIDCAASAFVNWIIADNIIDDCGNGGIELKTFAAALSPDVYESVSVSDNVIRMKLTGGVGVALNLVGTIPAGKAGKILIAGNLISCLTAPTTGAAVYGITGAAYVDTVIENNFVLNVCQGINLSGSGATGTTNSRTTIRGNTMDTVDPCITTAGSGTTLDNLHILNNSMKSVARTIQIATATVTNAAISYNRIESTTSYGMELRGTSDSAVSYNEIKAAINGVLTQGTACSNIDFVSNRITTSGGSASDAFSLGTGTGLRLLSNIINVPGSVRTVQGAATYTSAGNIRGMASADPSATIAGALGDVFLNSAPSSGGVEKWICTTAGNATLATYKGVAIA